jgi:ribosomal protein L34E
MSPRIEPDKETVRHERAVASLCDRTGAPLAEVRSLFAQEFSRLELGARVRSYLAVLTASNVRAMLRRKARRAQEDSQARSGGANQIEAAHRFATDRLMNT